MMTIPDKLIALSHFNTRSKWNEIDIELVEYLTIINQFTFIQSLITRAGNDTSPCFIEFITALSAQDMIDYIISPMQKKFLHTFHIELRTYYQTHDIVYTVVFKRNHDEQIKELISILDMIHPIMNAKYHSVLINESEFEGRQLFNTTIY